jgi:GNAT superfamily N-acetyltransferase
MIRLHWIDATKDPRYSDVLAIRRIANVHHGKIPETARDEDLADVFDRNAMIALLCVDEVAAGTVRICAPSDRQACDLARFPGFAETAGRCGSFVAGSRVAVLPAFQGRGLFWLLHDATPEKAEEKGARFVLAVATGWVLDQYVKAGWERTGLVFADPDFGGMAHEFIVLDVSRWRRRNPRVTSGS